MCWTCPTGSPFAMGATRASCEAPGPDRFVNQACLDPSSHPRYRSIAVKVATFALSKSRAKVCLPPIAKRTVKQLPSVGTPALLPRQIPIQPGSDSCLLLARGVLFRVRSLLPSPLLGIGKPAVPPCSKFWPQTSSARPLSEARAKFEFPPVAKCIVKPSPAVGTV